MNTFIKITLSGNYNLSDNYIFDDLLKNDTNLSEVALTVRKINFVDFIKQIGNFFMSILTESERMACKLKRF